MFGNDDDRFSGYDPEGDRERARENVRFLAEMYADEDPPCDCRFKGDTADTSDCPAHGDVDW